MKRLLVLLVAASAAWGQSKFSPDLFGPPNLGFGISSPQNNYSAWYMHDVIIQFKSNTAPAMLNGYGGQIKYSFSNTMPAISVKLPVYMIKALENDPTVQYITPNRKTFRTLDVTTTATAANLVWSYGYTGAGVGVAVIDSGVTLKNDLRDSSNNSRIVYSESFVPGTDASDVYGHGTHVAGIIGGNGSASSGPGMSRTLKGVAPGVNIINLKVLDATGVGDESNVIAAINRAIQLKNTYNIRVINLSLGRSVYESYHLDPLCQAVEAAWNAGIVVVVAAGNRGRDNTFYTRGYGSVASPANDPYVITVGATNSKGTMSTGDDIVASYSSKGPSAIDHIVKPDLVAPGNAIVSLMASPSSTLAAMSGTKVHSSFYAPGTSGYSTDYMKLSGTSMATPVVAGAAALMIQKQPSLTPDQIKARLMKTARKTLPPYMTGWSTRLISYFNQSDVFTVGAGSLDAFAALQSTETVTMPALSPKVVYSYVGRHVAFVRNLSLTWGDSLVWGDVAIYGSFAFKTVINGSSLIWGDSIVWGMDADPGFSLVWGDTINGLSLLRGFSDDDWDE